MHEIAAAALGRALLQVAQAAAGPARSMPTPSSITSITSSAPASTVTVTSLGRRAAPRW